jgi:probable rRNA maturation factor
VAIEVLNKQRLVDINKNEVAALAGATLALVRRQVNQANAISQSLSKTSVQNELIADVCMTVVFVRDKKIRTLNRDYRDKDYATDVLSFRVSDQQDETSDFGEENYIGDIVISTDTAMHQAEEAKQTFEREVQELVIHGVLHLCGYDHETDNGEMNRLELKLRKKLLD